MTICEQLANHFCCTELWEFLKLHSSGIKDISIALIGGGFGAYFGAWGAQKIIESQKGRAESLKDLNNLNVAITLSYNICNALINSKKQFIRDLKRKYEEEKAQLAQHSQGIKAGTVLKAAPFKAAFNLQTLPVPKLPLESLGSILFDRLALPSGFITVYSTLNLTCDSLWLSIDRRNELIEIYKARGGPTLEEYFGLLDSTGRINEDYPSLVNAIYSQTDNAIFFSHLLCNELGQYAKSAEGNFKKSYGSGAPKVVMIDWSIAEAGGLLPNAGGFQEFLAMFKEM